MDSIQSKPWLTAPLSIDRYTDLQFHLLKDLGSLIDNSWHCVDGALTELVEFEEGLIKGDLPNMIEELGDTMFFICIYARLHKIDLYAAFSDYREVTIETPQKYVDLLLRRLIKLADINKGVKVNSREFKYDEIETLICTVYHQVTLLADSLDINMDEILYKNYEKLKARYPDGYSDHSANNRNLVAEREILES